MSRKSSLWTITLLIALCCGSLAYELKGSQLYIQVVSEHEQEVEKKNYKTSINSMIKSEELKLTQSSRIHIEAELEFGTSQFIPEFVSFRLRHSQHQNLTEPILATYNSIEERFDASIDLGNPRHIKPFSGKYQLQVIVSDDKLKQNVRNVVANCDVTFRKSWDSVPPSELSYQTAPVIETSAPATRVDPPQMFTGFVMLVILAAGVVFLYGLGHLKANFSLFPSQSAVGLLMNLLLVGTVGAYASVLVMFWIKWTFLTTLNYLLLLLLPSAIIANYALVHVKKI